MDFKLIKMREDMIGESSKLLKSMSPFFYSKVNRYVNFSLEFNKNPILVSVFYSKTYWSARFKSNNELIHAFGRYDEKEFLLSTSKFNALNPLFLFSLPINYTETEYGALFVQKGKKLNLMSKIYDLPKNAENYLKESGLILELEDEDYFLFDFGNCKNILLFLRNVEEYTKTFDFRLNDSNRLIIDLNPFKTPINNENYNYCMLCGNNLDLVINKELKECADKFEAKCEKCLEKIYVLDLYYKLKDSPVYKYLSEESLVEFLDDEYSGYYAWNLLIKFNMLEHFSGDLHKLCPNESIEEKFSSFLKPKEVKSKISSKLDDYWSKYDNPDDEDDERLCKICGKSLDYEITDICDDCFNKKETIKSLKNLLDYVVPGRGFSKSDLNNNFSTLELDIIISDLIKYELLKPVGDNDLFILDGISNLNRFIEEYSDESLIDESKFTEKDKISLSILSEDLIDEESLDNVINLVNYTQYVFSSFDRRLERWFVEFKEDENVLARKYFKTPFDAKLAAVNYLKELSIIQVLSDSEEEVSSEDKDKYLKTCPACNNEFYANNTYTKYCDDCKDQYTPQELIVLSGINEGIYAEDLAIKINNLKKVGKSNREIARSCKLRGENLIPAIMKFLLPEEEIDVETSDRISESSNSNVCVICDKQFKGDSQSEYCPECKEKYSAIERIVLKGIKSGKFTKELVKDILKLKDEGKSNPDIAKELDIQYPVLIPNIIKFLDDNSDVPIKEGQNITSNLRVCPVCGEKFYPNTKFSTSQRYCNECKGKYNGLELSVLVKIGEGEFDQSLSNNIQNMLNSGFSKTEIAKKFELNNTSLINPIIKFLPYKKEGVEDIKSESTYDSRVCSVCGKEFRISSKFGYSQKYCEECKSKFSGSELPVLVKIKEGEINQDLSNNIQDMLNNGFSRKEVAEKINLYPYYWIEPIIKFLPYKKECSGEEPISEETEYIVKSNKPYKNIKITRHSNHVNVVLNGLISNNDRFVLFTRFSFLDEFNLNYIECKKVEKYFKIKIDLNFKMSEYKFHINKFKSMGWTE